MGQCFVFAGGGTGGHLYPGLAVAQELAVILPEAKIVFLCSDRDIDRRILEATAYAMVPQPVRPLPKRLGQLPLFAAGWLSSRRLARGLLKDTRPAAVLGLGGFAAGPAVRAAFDLGIRSALMNPDAVPGKANKYLARCAAAIFTQFQSTREQFPASVRQRVQTVGCPIRPALADACREKAIARFQLRPDRKTLLVLGGSLGAASINEAIQFLASDLDELTDSWQVLHIAGPAHAAPAEGNRAIGLKVLQYCHEMDLAYAAADLALCRGGAVTVAELAATCTPAVILPYPHHSDRQQRLNAAELVEAGAAVVCEDAIDGRANAELLRGLLLPLLADADRLAKMKHAAAGMGRPQAASRIARWLAWEQAPGAV